MGTRRFFSSLALLPIAAPAEGQAGNSAPAGPARKLCALTFDDGPDAVKTPRVLDRLAKYGVVASFFVVGRMIDGSTAPVLKRALSMGCELDNHSWDYDALDSASEDAVRESIARTTAAIERYAGVSPAFFRPPNLAVSPTLFGAAGLPTAGGVMGNDWIPTMTAEDRAAMVLMGMRDGAIIVLHDVQPDPHPTPEALDILIPELKSRGYEFLTLVELFRRKGVDPWSGRLWQYVE